MLREVFLERGALQILHHQIGGPVGREIVSDADYPRMLLELRDHPGFIQKALEPILKVLSGNARMRNELAGLTGTAREAAWHVSLDCHPPRQALVPGQIGDCETARAQPPARHRLLLEQRAKR